MAFTPVSPFSSVLFNRVIAATFIGASVLAIAPAQASVLVDPLVRQDTPEASSATDTGESLVDIAANTGDFSTLAAAVQAANLIPVLSAEGPFTMFAPTDAAFAGLPAGTLDTLLLAENQDLLVKLIYNHVGYGNFTSDELNAGSFNTFDGTVAVNVAPNGVTVDGANVVQADVTASNGVVHAVDQVLLPAGFTEQLAARMGDNTSVASTTEAVDESGSAAASRISELQATIIDRSAPPAPAVTSAPPVAPQPAAAEPLEAEEQASEAESEPAAQEPIRGLW